MSIVLAKPIASYGGATKISLNQLPPEAWQIISGDESDGNTIGAFMARALHLRAAAMASFPYSIFGAGGEPLYSSGGDAVPNSLAWLGDIATLLYRMELSAVMTGKAYFHIMRNRVRPIEIRYMRPTSVKPVWSVDGSLSHFERTRGSQRIRLEPDEVLHCWLPDVNTEIGPPSVYPGKTALAAAGVLGNMDAFLSQYFERGLVKATLLTTTGVVNPADRERLKAWWQRIFSGARNAFAAEVVKADAVTPVVIGEGLKDLGNTQLTEEKRQDILTALGISHSLAMSNAANYATAQQDEETFIAYTVQPQARLHQRTLNAQVLEPLGLTMRFESSRHEAMQRAELRKAEAVQRAAGVPIMTINEARAIMALGPIDGGDVLASSFGQSAINKTETANVSESDADPEPVKTYDDAGRRDGFGKFARWYTQRPGADVDLFNHAHLTHADKVVAADRLLRRAVEAYP